MMQELLEVYQYSYIYSYYDATTEYEVLIGKCIDTPVIKADGEMIIGGKAERRSMYWKKTDWDMLFEDYQKRIQGKDLIS